MDLCQLCEKTGIPSRITCRLLQKQEALREQETLIRQLTDPKQAAAAYHALAKILGDDDMAMLACQLEAAALCCDRFTAMGVEEQIMVDTMKCFSRFLSETKAMTGCYKFDRGWWTWRQTGGLLFRIGQLEYEIVPHQKAVSLHIPSDAVFTPAEVEKSLNAARDFFAHYFPDYARADWVCHSWLLSPKLRELLPETSNIVSFQNRFTITHRDPDDRDFTQWLFAVPADTPVETLPENTTLQKKTKQLLRQGGNIGAAGGILL